jgi:hypothetical protein
MKLRRVILLGCLIVAVTVREGRAQSCCGDCDADGRVRVAEIVAAIAINLGRSDGAACPDAPRSIDGLVCAVGSLLHGCPDVPPLPTATPLPPTPIPAWTHSPTITPVGPEPDVVVAAIHTRHDTSSGCGPFESLIVCLANRGGSPTAAFRVEIDDVDSFVVDDLQPLEERCFSRPLTRSSGSGFTVRADVENDVEEVDELNNTLTKSVRWPTIPATCTATRTRTPTPTRRATSTAGPATLWMTLVPCRQCSGCALSLDEQLGLIAGTDWVDRFVPAGVEVLESSTSMPGGVCLACDCPAGPILRALVQQHDVETMRRAGWSVSR